MYMKMFLVSEILIRVPLIFSIDVKKLQSVVSNSEGTYCYIYCYSCIVYFGCYQLSTGARND